jgi:hypothetical protein
MARSIERIGADEPLELAVSRSFEHFRDAEASNAALMFDVGWVPTTDLVEMLAKEIAETDGLQSLTLIHPSAAMTFIASVVSSRCAGIKVDARRSLYDDGEDDEGTDATASKTLFMMAPHERHEAFVRRAVMEARTRIDRKFALMFDNSKPLPRDLADILFEELLHSGAKEVGLVYAGDGLDVIAASLRLRLPSVVIALATERPSEPRLKP